MEKKAIALADSTIKPVSGNEEPGVVARQSSNSSCVLPIKKRLYLRASIHPERSFSNENESKTKDSGLNPSSNLMKANPNTSSGPSRNVEDVVKPALAEKLAGQEFVGKQGESHSKVELRGDSGRVELSLGPKKPHVSALSLNKNDVDDSAFINRCNWDLNTTMDSWIQDATQIDLNSSLDTKPPPISSASVIASNADKGKQLVGANNEQEFNRKMNSPTVKSEAVGETLVQGTAIHPSGAFEANVVKTEVVRHNMQSSELLGQKPVKCEPIQEEISDVIAPQSVGRVLQLQESSSSTPSDHTNALDQENADIAAKNANFDLKVLNVSSDKVEASVSASMNIEDHTVYKTTLNLVTSGKGSANDDEKYEDGEIREPMMQSHADFLKRCDEKAEKLIWSSRSEREISLSNKRCGKVIYYMEEEKFHRRRNRFQDRSFGSSRGNFMRGRGRGWGRERNFESYGGVADYRFRHQRTAPWLNGASFARDPVYSHQKSMYDGPDGHFVQGNTKFTASQRSSGFPRMQSKSPVRSRTWSSPRRRLTEGYNDHQDSSQHRSPFMYREDRMRSSPQTFKAIAPQRRDSPSYTPYRLNHDTRDVYAVQEHRHPRSLSSRRSPPGRFPELHSSDDRRKYGKGQMRNVEGGQSEQHRHEDEFDVSRLKKRRF